MEASTDDDRRDEFVMRGAETFPPRVDVGNGEVSVLAQTAYPSDVASARVRVAGFAAFLQPHGVALTYAPTLTNAGYKVIASSGNVVRKTETIGWAAIRAVAEQRHDHDLLFVHRLRLLNPLPGFDPPRELDVYDIDDPLFVPFRGGVNHRFRWGKREASRCIACLRRARLVLAGNPYLAAHIREHASRVEVVPSCIDTAHQPIRFHHDTRPVTVGWIGSPTTSPYLQSVFPVLARINADKLRAKLVLVGADHSLAAPWIVHHPWSLATQADLLASFDIGIMPQPDDDWARAKCGYKVLQYFAAGVPAVASPVGVARELIGGDRGLIASTPDEWYRCLSVLIDDPQRRAELGAAGRVFVERRYSYGVWAPELAAILRSLAR
jgi:glycosyltransferase involved in cell wall biosynthesis